MTKKYRRPRSLAAIWAGPPASLALTIIVMASIAHRLGVLPTYPFLWSLAVAGLLALLSALLAVRGLVSLWQTGAEGGRKSAWALFLAIVALAPFADAGFRLATLPAIVEVSTNLADPPQLAAASRPADPFINPLKPIDEATAAAQTSNYPQVVGRRYSLAPDQLGDIAVRLLKARGWPVTGRSGAGTAESPVLVTAVARTLIFAIPADIAIRIRDDGETSIVDMRSQIRYGTHDLGLDADFVTAYLDALDAAVAASQSG